MSENVLMDADIVSKKGRRGTRGKKTNVNIHHTMEPSTAHSSVNASESTEKQKTRAKEPACLAQTSTDYCTQDMEKLNVSLNIDKKNKCDLQAVKRLKKKVVSKTKGSVTSRQSTVEACVHNIAKLNISSCKQNDNKGTLNVSKVTKIQDVLRTDVLARHLQSSQKLCTQIAVNSEISKNSGKGKDLINHDYRKIWESICEESAHKTSDCKQLGPQYENNIKHEEKEPENGTFINFNHTKETRTMETSAKYNKKMVNTNIEENTTGKDEIKIARQGERKKKSKDARLNKADFSDHIPIAIMKEILENQSPDDMQYIKGQFRINPRFYKNGYLTMPDDETDLLIVGLRDRNRAFNGDTVVAKIYPPDKWHTHTDGKKQKTGYIVSILEKLHPRKAVGQLKQQGSLIFLYPRDQRTPIIKINPNSLPKYMRTTLTTYQDFLFLANITYWNSSKAANGKMIKIIGPVGDLEAEMQTILLNNGLDVTPYSETLMKDLPCVNYVLTPMDIGDREDWRQSCIITIDPVTATDIDDAVSCRVLPNGNFEVGVHIADVTHFLEFGSMLDIEVAKRATTVYTVDSVYHMLPRQLCHVCSLFPGVDKLTFSVIWEMTSNAQIVNQRFTKSVVNSCCQMSYDEAQAMIENTNELPESLRVKGSWTPSEIAEMVNNLYKLSLHLRNKRFENGALRIDQPKLNITVDKISQQPVSYCIEEIKDANRLIEEFMLLANVTVATCLYEKLPEASLLRCHPNPAMDLLAASRDLLQSVGVHLNIESSGSLQASIKRYEISSEQDFEGSEDLMKYRMLVITNLCSKAMSRAVYKCSSAVSTQDDLKHYALNVPLYTHFTSPIRRYPDCVVHRLLYSIIKYEPLPQEWNSTLCNKIARNCSAKRNFAKTAQEQCSILYFTHLVAATGPMSTIAIVLDVKDHSIDVVLCNTGIKLRIYMNNLQDGAKFQHSMDHLASTITITWKNQPTPQIINVFTILHVQIEKHPTFPQLLGTLLPPKNVDGCNM